MRSRFGTASGPGESLGMFTATVAITVLPSTSLAGPLAAGR